MIWWTTNSAASNPHQVEPKSRGHLISIKGMDSQMHVYIICGANLLNPTTFDYLRIDWTTQKREGHCQTARHVNRLPCSDKDHLLWPDEWRLWPTATGFSIHRARLIYSGIQFRRSLDFWIINPLFGKEIKWREKKEEEKMDSTGDLIKMSVEPWYQQLQ